MDPDDFFQLNDKLKLGKTFIKGTKPDGSMIVMPDDDEVDFKKQCPMVVRWRLIDNQYVNEYMILECEKIFFHQNGARYHICKNDV